MVENGTSANGKSPDVLAYQLDELRQAMNDIKQSLAHMATKEQVAQLVSRNEFDRLSWDLVKHREDTTREISDLKEKHQARSAKAILGNWTLVVSAITSTLALIVAITGWRPVH